MRATFTRIGTRSGALLLLAAAGVATEAWLARSIFFPADGPRGPEFIFISASFATFLAGLAAALVGVVVVHLIVCAGERAHAHPPAPAAGNDVRYLAPLLLCWMGLVPLAGLWPGTARWLAPVIYLVVDARVWWWAVVGVWVLARIERRLRPDAPPPIRLAADWAAAHHRAATALLALVAAVWVVEATPRLRFSAVLNGDEPKYIRFDEGFYQGKGVEISTYTSLSDLPAGFRPHVWRNLELLAAAVPHDLADLASDAIAFAHHPGRRFNRSTYAGHWFIQGKNGGLYQVHTPGFSALIFPAYYLDRRFAASDPGYQGEFPARLFWSNLMLLAVYLVWAGLVFRFFRLAVGGAGAAWLAAAAVALSAPGTTYVFQFYPELAAGAVLLGLSSWLWFARRQTWQAVVGFGLLAGGLPWLHVRFLPAAAWLVAWAAFAWRREWRRIVALAGGFAAAVGAYSLYIFHISGSIVPTALYSGAGSEDIVSLPRMGVGLVAIFLDRDWGLFGPSPLYILALPGFWLLWRRNRALTLFVLGLIAVLIGPAASVSIAGAGTHLRFFVAAAPFFGLGVAEMLTRAAKSRVWQAAAGLLIILSLQNDWAYSEHLRKEMTLMRDWSVSGWKTLLLMPTIGAAGGRVSGITIGLAAIWIGALAALVIGVARGRGAGGWVDRLERRSLPMLASLAVVLVLLMGEAVSAATGAWWSDGYRMPSAEAAVEAALRVDALGHCGICATSATGVVGTADVIAALQVVTPIVALRSERLHAGPTYADWLAMPGLIRQWYVEANGYPPASADIGHYLYQWREEGADRDEIRRRILRAGRQDTAGGRQRAVAVGRGGYLPGRS